MTTSSGLRRAGSCARTWRRRSNGCWTIRAPRIWFETSRANGFKLGDVNGISINARTVLARDDNIDIQKQIREQQAAFRAQFAAENRSTNGPASTNLIAQLGGLGKTNSSAKPIGTPDDGRDCVILAHRGWTWTRTV